MIHRALTHNVKFPLRLLYSAEHERDLLYRDELQTLARQHTRFVFEPILPQPSAREGGLQGPFREYVQEHYVKRDEDRNRYFYICGVGTQVTQLRDLLRGAGYQRRAVLYEKW